MICDGCGQRIQGKAPWIRVNLELSYDKRPPSGPEQVEYHDEACVLMGIRRRARKAHEEAQSTP